MKFLSLIFTFAFSLHLSAAETGSSPAHRTSTARSSSGKDVCVNNGNAFDPRNEAGAKSLFQSHHLDAREALTRLVLSEGLSTNVLQKGKCGTQLPLQNIFNSIADGIQLRSIKGKQSSAFTEVFRKNQYATSFTPKTKRGGAPNPFAQIFLCPSRFENYKNELKNARVLKPAADHLSSDDVYRMAQAAADQALRKKNVSEFGDIKTTTNFFYPQSPIYGHLHPKWATPANLIKNIESNCVVFYNVR